MKKSVLQALEEQIQREYEAAFLYRQAYFWFDQQLFPGISAWFKVPFTHKYLS